jgi:hypothetical protein
LSTTDELTRRVWGDRSAVASLLSQVALHNREIDRLFETAQETRQIDPNQVAELLSKLGACHLALHHHYEAQVRGWSWQRPKPA